MSDSSGGDTPISEQDVEVDKETLKRIRERVLQAEKEKLHMDLPRGIINDIEAIIREEVQ